MTFEKLIEDLPNYCLEKEFPRFNKDWKKMFPLVINCPNCKNKIYKNNTNKFCPLNINHYENL